MRERERTNCLPRVKNGYSAKNIYENYSSVNQRPNVSPPSSLSLFLALSLSLFFFSYSQETRVAIAAVTAEAAEKMHTAHEMTNRPRNLARDRPSCSSSSLVCLSQESSLSLLTAEGQDTHDSRLSLNSSIHHPRADARNRLEDKRGERDRDEDARTLAQGS